MSDPSTKAAHYRKRAIESLRRAEDPTLSETARNAYVDLAVSYERLASDMDAILANRVWLHKDEMRTRSYLAR